jgi:xylulokinase
MSNRQFVAGVDSSTQSCKVVIVDPSTGQILRQGRARHPEGTSVNPERWWEALLEAIEQAGGLADVKAIAIAGQQHGLVALDAKGQVVRDALLWNDTRSAPQAQKLQDHFGPDWLASNTGSLPVASFTSTKLLWVRENEPELAKQIAAVALPHDWLTWKLAGYAPDISKLVTDRSDASGTGYFNSQTNTYLNEVLEFCIGRQIQLPRVANWNEVVGEVIHDIAGGAGCSIGPGMGDNAGAAMGLRLDSGEIAISIGTSGTIFGVSDVGSNDTTGVIAGFASSDGRFLPLVCTLNATGVLEWGARILGVSLDELGALAMKAKPGAGGIELTPYFEGERTPNLPDATASMAGMTLANGTRENFARACIEGMLRGLGVGRELITQEGIEISAIKMIGGGAANQGVRDVATELFGDLVSFPDSAEYVALGAAHQAASLKN